MDFKNKEKYRKWLAYGHMHDIFENTKGNQLVRIKGKIHAVRHRKSGLKDSIKRMIRKELY